MKIDPRFSSVIVVAASLFLFGATVTGGTALAANVGTLGKTLSMESGVGSPSGAHYSIWYQDAFSADWTVKRPSSRDENIVLCVPAAFTDTFMLMQSVHGLCFERGKCVNDKADKDIGGALGIANGVCQIMSMPHGKLSDERRKFVENQKASLFQQFQVVKDGKAEKFKDKSLFQRRGLCIFKTHRCGVIESDRAITLSQFAEDAAALGASDLVYFDMGPWDEGWYRDPASGRVVVIGLDRSSTNRQTNWFVFKKRS